MKKRIFVVDDDTAIRSSLQKVLQAAGYEVLLAKDGTEALHGSEGETIDLLLIDLNLPLKSGWDTLEVLTDRFPSVPIFIITGLANQYEMALVAGVGALMEKPIEVPALLKTIDELLAESRDDRARRLNSGSYKTRYIPSSGTQLIQKLRERAVTPYPCIQPRHTYPGSRLRSGL